jgi:hypothetical protein
MPPERLCDRRGQDIVAILLCQAPAYRDADNIPGKAVDEFEHRDP